MLRYLPQGAKTALDVGCGEGGFAENLKLAGVAEVWGADINKSAVEKAKTSGKIDHGIDEDVTKNLELCPDNYFDVIFCNDSLEHFVDPKQFLIDIQSKLKPNGRVIASIPNIRYFRVLVEILFKRDFKYVESGVLDKTHLRFFTKKSAIRMFEEAGFSIDQVDLINRTKSIKIIPFHLFTLFTLGRDVAYPQMAISAVRRPTSEFN